MRRHPFLFYFSILVGLPFAAIFLVPPASACGCIPPLTEEEVSKLYVEAQRGDRNAISELLSEFIHVQRNSSRAAKMAKLAVKFGAPDALESLASDQMGKLRFSKSMGKSERRERSRRALVLMELASRYREHLDEYDGVFNNRAWFASNLRESRAIQRMLDTEPNEWLLSANSGDADAAYHLAMYFGYVAHDRDKYDFWAKRAGELGDPSFAGTSIDWHTYPSKALEQVDVALSNGDKIAAVGDKWMQDTFKAELQRARRSYRARQSTWWSLMGFFD